VLDRAPIAEAQMVVARKLRWRRPHPRRDR
jgi:hypothetical protein